MAENCVIRKILAAVSDQGFLREGHAGFQDHTGDNQYSPFLIRDVEDRAILPA